MIFLGPEHEPTVNGSRAQHAVISALAEPEQSLPPARPRTRPVPQTEPNPAPPARRRERVPNPAYNPTIQPERALNELLTLMRANELIPETITWPEEITLRRWARSDAQRRQEVIRRLVEKGNLRNARRAMREHNKKLSVRLVSLLAAARRNFRPENGPFDQHCGALRLRRLAAAINAVGDVKSFAYPAKATRTLKKKANGGIRPLVRFDWVDDARLRVLRAALTPFADLHDSQFLMGQYGRRGPASVREALLQALRLVKEDHVFLQFDVKDFFGSISHAWLEENLPFDKGTLRRFVHMGDMQIVTLRERRVGQRLAADASNENGRSGFGIPQGSALSSLVAEMVMADILRSDAVFEGLRLFTWSDNLGALVPRSEAYAVMEHVQSAFVRHGAGPFQLSIENHSVISEFKFLGVWYQVVAGTPHAFIPEAVARGWADQVNANILTAGDAELEKMEQRIRGQEAAWGWWCGMAPLAQEMRMLLWAAYEAPRAAPQRVAA